MLNRREIFQNLLGLMALTAIPATVLAKEAAQPNWALLRKRMIINRIHKEMEKASKIGLFEINDGFTQSQAKSILQPYLRDLKNGRFLYDYMIVCDETNNTTKVVDANQFKMEVYLKFPNDIAFTHLLLVTHSRGMTFEEAVGSLA